MSAPLLATLLHGGPLGNAGAAVPLAYVAASVLVGAGVGVLAFWYYERRLAARDA